MNLPLIWWFLVFQYAKILFICDLRFNLVRQNYVGHYMKRFLLLFLISGMMLFQSCREDWTFSTDSRCRLQFSADTIRLDTVFTGEVSATAGFMIYNTNNSGIRFDAVMGGGAGSPFRMNLDGEGGSTITGLEIGGGDSLFCFISVKVPESDDSGLTDAFDSIRFILESGTVQFVRLHASGQNAVRLRGSTIDHNTVFSARLPYVIYDTLRVAGGAVLTLEPGCRMYFHKDAVLDLAGTIVAQGTPDSVIIMRGDRLDLMLPRLPYDLLNAQWGGICLGRESTGNIFSYCDIHGGSWGIRADSSGTDKLKMSVVSSVIHNVSGNGIEATSCRIEVANSQITNAGGSCVDIAGGLSDFTFCTIAGFSVWTAGLEPVSLKDNRDEKPAPIEGAVFRNCIITGRNNKGFTVTVDSLRDKVPFSISNSLIMVQDTTDVRYRDVVFENRDSKAYGSSNFTDRTSRGYGSVFTLDSLSRARGIADTLSRVWTVDLAGVPRPYSGADAGCYQYVPQ